MFTGLFDSTLAHSRRIIAWDARGHGNSPEGEEPFDYWDQARDVLGLMDALKVSQAVVGGVSQGGRVHRAAGGPGRVRRHPIGRPQKSRNGKVADTCLIGPARCSVRPRPPRNWQPLIDPRTESRHRKGVLIGLGVLGLVGGAITAFAGFAMAAAFLFAATPDGYSVDDVCWANDGTEAADGEPLAEVFCSEDHDYVSGPNVPTADDCPEDTERYLDEPDGTVTCLEPPRTAAGTDGPEDEDASAGLDG